MTYDPAFTTHSRPDVDDERFYADAVAWAKANDKTTGCDNGATSAPNATSPETTISGDPSSGSSGYSPST